MEQPSTAWSLTLNDFRVGKAGGTSIIDDVYSVYIDTAKQISFLPTDLFNEFIKVASKWDGVTCEKAACFYNADAQG